MDKKIQVGDSVLIWGRVNSDSDKSLYWSKQPDSRQYSFQVIDINEKFGFATILLDGTVFIGAPWASLGGESGKSSVYTNVPYKSPGIEIIPKKSKPCKYCRRS